MTLMERRRGMMGAGNAGSDFVQLEYIQSPSSSPKDAMILLPQTFESFVKVVLDIKLSRTDSNIVFTSWSGTNQDAPYCGSPLSGMTRSPKLSTLRTTYTFTKTSETHGSYLARIGGWGDNVFSAENSYYEAMLLDSNDAVIADYVFGYLKSTGETGAYDVLTGTFYPEKTGLVGFIRGPEV